MTYVPFTRTCVSAIINGVPVGTQMAWLSCRSKGSPLEVTRTAATIQFAITQGPLAAMGGGKAQPAMT
jgi:hypothetical protein